MNLDVRGNFEARKIILKSGFYKILLLSIGRNLILHMDFRMKWDK